VFGLFFFFMLFCVFCSFCVVICQPVRTFFGYFGSGLFLCFCYFFGLVFVCVVVFTVKRIFSCCLGSVF